MIEGKIEKWWAYCPKCGEELIDVGNDFLCPKCGWKGSWDDLLGIKK